MLDPRAFAAAAEGADIPLGRYGERFGGYGVMGLPFRSGHVLALRRFPANSLGGPYTSVWHRDPSGRWTFRQNAPAEQACSRYFDAAIDRTLRTELELVWPGPRTLEVTGEDLHWRVELASTGVTRMLNDVAARLPPRAWASPMVLRAMGRIAGTTMRAGRVGLQGTSPNGQRYQAHPLRVWMVTDSSAVVAGHDLGEPGPVAEQGRMGDFWLPQRGVFAIGRSFFETFDPERHLAVHDGA